MKLEEYRLVGNKKLRCGYTTGTCAAAAAKAATYMLLAKEQCGEVSILTPKGIKLVLPVEKSTRENFKVSCAIQKDSGDDSDVTHGSYVYAEVTFAKSGFMIDGGLGVGRVTKPGLDQPVGAAAINSVPRKMIRQAVESVCEQFDYHGGLKIIISIPEGITLAKKTFNPKLGIEGGISILGTSGIVEPMSEAALVDTIRVELKMKAAEHKKYVILTPGNYGERFLKEELQISLQDSVKCSNFIGDTIEITKEYQFEGILLVGHIGKLIKLGAGIMNTHSKWADARFEVLVTCALLAGADTSLLKRLLSCVTTDDGIALLRGNGLLEPTMIELMKRIESHVERRCEENLRVGVMVFSNQYGLLGKTKEASDILVKIKEQDSDTVS